jgi:antitoxin VapB
LGAHDRQHRARHGREAEEICVEHRAHIGVVAFLDGREIAVAGIVDEDVDAAKPRFGRLDRGLDLILLVDVERERKAILIMTGDNVFDLGLIARGHDDAVAALKEDDGELPTESGRAAGDEPNRFGMGVRHDGLAQLEVGKARVSHDAPQECNACCIDVESPRSMHIKTVSSMLQIRNRRVVELAAKLAAVRRSTKTEAVLTALENELARIEREKSLAERLKPLQERIAAVPLTGLEADKDFYDDLSGDS